MRTSGAAIKLLLRRIVEVLLALVILFEEWGWEPLQQAMARIGRWPVLRQLEALIRRLPPGVALVLLMVPTLALLPIKLGAVWMIGRGWRLGGLIVIVVAKVLGTAVMARLFELTRPALMRLPWFVRFYARWTGWKSEVLGLVRSSPVWRASAALHTRLLGLWQRWRAHG